MGMEVTLVTIELVRNLDSLIVAGGKIVVGDIPADRNGGKEPKIAMSTNYCALR